MLVVFNVYSLRRLKKDLVECFFSSKDSHLFTLELFFLHCFLQNKPKTGKQALGKHVRGFTDPGVFALK